MAIALAIHAAVPLNHDVAWIVEGAGRLLDGGQFGRDVVDANPPLAWWLSCVPAAFARLTGSSLALSSVLFTLGYGLAGVLLTNAALAQGTLDDRTRGILVSILPVLLLIAPAYDFGQREHLMLIGAIPYLAAVSVTAERRALNFALATAIGLFAASALCLKPYFLLVPIFTEAWLAMRRRSPWIWMRPEFLAIPIFGAIYVAAIRLFAPDYLAVVMPQAIPIYWAFNNPPLTVLMIILKTVALAMAGWLSILVAERKRPTAFALSAGFGAAGAAGGALLQMKGFSYHLVPVAGLAALACIADCLPRGRSSLKTLRIFIVASILAASVVRPVEQVRDAIERQGTSARVDALASVFRMYAGKGGSVYAFVTSPRDVHPAIVASHTVWASEACCVYHLPAAIRADERPAAERPLIRSVAASQLDRIVADLAARQPAVIVIDAWPEKLGIDRPFDYLPYLSNIHGFTKLWRHYSERQSVGGFRVFVRAVGP